MIIIWHLCDNIIRYDLIIYMMIYVTATARLKMPDQTSEFLGECQIDSNRIPDKMLDIWMSKYMSELMSNSVKQNVGIYVRW